AQVLFLFILYSGIIFMTFEDIVVNMCNTYSCPYNWFLRLEIFFYRLYPRALRWAMAMAYAIKQINEQNVLLPNITLGHAIYDSCFGVPNTVEAALDYLEPGADNNEPCYFGAVVGAYGSTLSVTLSRFMTLFCIPQLTYASGCKCLSDKRVFPSFLRTFPSDKHQASALADLVQHFGWLYVGTLAVNDDFGRSGVAQFIAEAEDNGVCLAFREILPKVRSDLLIQNLGRIVQRTKANTILLYTNEPDLFPFVEEIIMRNITDKTWLATHPWVSSPILGKKRYAEIFQGSIGFILRRGIVPGLQEFLKSLKPQVTLDYKTSFFRTGLSTDQKRTSSPDHRLCTGNEKLDEVESSFTDISQLRFTYNTYMAVNSVAHALHDLHICIPGEGPFGNGSCAHLHDLKPWQLLLYIRKVRFVNNLGENYHFDGNGDSPGVYELLNWQSNDKGSMEFKMVGTYDLRAPINHKLQVNDVPISVCNEACPSGTRTITLTGQPFCCFDCIACREGEFSNGSEDCIRCPKYFWSNEERSICMPMPEDFMALYDPIALILIILASIALLLTFSVGAIMLQKRESPVVNVTNRHVVGLLLLSVLCSLMSCILFVGKCSTFSVLFRLLFPGKPQMSLMKYFSDFGIICTCVIPQFIYCTIWAIAGFPHVIMNTNMQPGRIVIECAGASLAWPLCAVIYFVLIASVCLGLALKSRNLPVAFNEPKFITFTMMICFLVLFAFVPAYSSTQGKFSLATEMFAIIALSYNLIGCIFMPKCYIRGGSGRDKTVGNRHIR
uniref:Vomeronasal 2, receptor 1 n=1 Tax=Eptatretus burgeri TaxID=7764 RepID=A0A8C4QM07_EPTBU